MMAILMCGNLCLGMYQIERPTSSLRFNVQSFVNTYSTSSANYSSTTSIDNMELMRNELIFRLARRVSRDGFEYQLEYEIGKSKYTFSMYNHVEGIEEPNEKVNLKKLTSKFRDNLKARDLLIRFFNS